MAVATQWLCSKQSSVRWLVEWDVAAFVDEEASEEEGDVVDPVDPADPADPADTVDTEDTVDHQIQPKAACQEWVSQVNIQVCSTEEREFHHLVL